MRALLALLVLLLQASCLPDTEFTCDGNSDCPNRGNSSGVCESIGYCSYMDTSCDFDRRFSEYAGDGLASQCVACPMDGHLVGKGKCYVKVSSGPWPAARDACSQLFGSGFHLAKVDDTSENQLLDDEFSGNAWIGGSDEASEGTWVWTDGSKIDVASGPWTSGGPDGGTGENCLLYDAGAAEWDDQPCDSDHDFICEQP